MPLPKPPAKGNDRARPSVGVAASANSSALDALLTALADEDIDRIDIRQRRLIMDGSEQATFDDDDEVGDAISRVSGVTLNDEQPVARASFAGGWEMTALMPSMAGAHVVNFHRAAARDTTLEALVEAGALSQGAAALLAAAMEARLGLLVVGDRSGASSMARALVAAAPATAHVAWLVDSARRAAPKGTTPIHIGDPSTQADAFDALLALAPDHIVAPGLFGRDMARLLELIARGAEGVVATAPAANMDAALGRTAGSIAAAQGMATEAARSWLVASFSIGIEVARQRTGDLRIARLSWLGDGATAPGHESLIVGGKVTTKARELVEQLRARGFSIDRATIEKR
jgi:pilus assembly protein CpaF